MRILVNMGAEMLKEGTPLMEFVPFTEDFAVEMLIDGNDIPLVQGEQAATDSHPARPGDPVRLQFEGWPAVQFVGWPSVAVGTFGGRVQLIDETPYKNGKFRILVVPIRQINPGPSRGFCVRGTKPTGGCCCGMSRWAKNCGGGSMVSRRSSRFDEPGKKPEKRRHARLQEHRRAQAEDQNKVGEQRSAARGG